METANLYVVHADSEGYTKKDIFRIKAELTRLNC
jgi:hypothetical protein